MKKKIIFLIIIIFAATTIATLILTNIKNKDNSYSLADDPDVQKLYEYGEYIESLDIPPNTIVARINGEEILFHEVESYRHSINYSIEHGTEESMGKNAFYEVLGNKLAAYMAKKCIEQMLTVKGNQIIADFMLEKPELVNDNLLEEKIEERNKIKEKQKELYDEGEEEKALELSSESIDLYGQIREIYIKDLILNSDLELCVDKGELSYTVPTIYSE